MQVSVSENAILDCAYAMAGELRRLIGEERRAIAIIGVQSAQAGLIDNLVTEPGIDWTRVVCFHTREQIGCAEESPISERWLLNRELVARVPIAEFHGLRGEAANLNAVCSNYDALLRSKSPHVALIDAGHLLEAPASPSSQVVVTGVMIAMTQNAILSCDRLFVIAASRNEIEALKRGPAGRHDGMQVFTS
jgi:hypothetical protein